MHAVPPVSQRNSNRETITMYFNGSAYGQGPACRIQCASGTAVYIVQSVALILCALLAYGLICMCI